MHSICTMYHGFRCGNRHRLHYVARQPLKCNTSHGLSVHQLVESTIPIHLCTRGGQDAGPARGTSMRGGVPSFCSATRQHA